MATAITKLAEAGEVLLSEGDQKVTRDSKEITNGTGGQITLNAGYPMDDNVPVVATGEANTDGILLASVVIEDGESIKVPVLARGPAAFIEEAIVVTDHQGVGMTLATIVTALETLEIVIGRNVPATVEEQVT